jgi:hypothetical protein
MDASLIVLSLIAAHARSSTSIEHGHGDASEQKGPTLHDGVRMNDDRWAFPPQPPAWPPAPSATPPRRTARTLAAIALFVATGVVAAGIGVGGVLLVRHIQGQPTSNSPTAGPGTSSGAAEARALYQQAVTATGASAGFHYDAVSTGSDAQTIVGDAGQANGRQAITFDSGYGAEQFTLLLLGSTVYFQGNAPAVEDQLGVTTATAASVAGKWVSVKSGDGPYSVLQPGITTQSQAGEMPLTAESSAKVTGPGGAAATKITGVVPASANVPAGTGTLLIASSSDLPITYTSTVSAGGTTLTFSTTFSNWGTAPSVSAPTGTVLAWSSLTTATPPGGYGSGEAPSGATPTPGAI